MISEIGSEFWLEKLQEESLDNIPEYIKLWGEEVILTSSGRGSITLMLKEINNKVKTKTALLPSYICKSVILPFINQGYDLKFYEVNNDLTLNIENISKFEDIGTFLHMGYFGYPTNFNLDSLITKFKNKSTIIIEDITHTLFSKYPRYIENDYYIGSLRKWFGVPSGGFLATDNKINTKLIEENNRFTNIRLEALTLKDQFINKGEEDVKDLYLNKFSEAEDILDRDPSSYKIDRISSSLINKIDTENIIRKRRENYLVLLEEIKKLKNIKPIFSNLKEGICPIFFPIMMKGERDLVRKRLIADRIYCPIHWPQSDKIGNKNLSIYENILSIPCDQRYEKEDMIRILRRLEELDKNIDRIENEEVENCYQ